MLSTELRPLSWNDMAGQKINKEILKKIIKSPETAPKSLIFEGFFGCGKTTSARIMARELNGITDPNFDLNNCPFYYEYDSTVIGNVEKIRELRDSFGVGVQDYWQVIVFDEIQACSNQAQTALLKVLEEVKGRTFFISCTTHIHKVIPTIRSRSLELKFGLVPQDEIVEHLGEVEKKLGITVPEDVKSIVASRSGGHMRNAHMLLDKYMLIGEETFKQSVKSSTNLYCEYFAAVRVNNQAKIMESLNGLMTIPLVDLKNDFSELVLMCMRGFTGFPITNRTVELLVKLYGADIMKLVTAYFSDWTKNIFSSDSDFQAGMLCFYTLLSSGGSSATTAVGARPEGNSAVVNRAAVRR
jgi:DNA polymerase III gamma/tau subunit